MNEADKKIIEQAEADRRKRERELLLLLLLLIDGAAQNQTLDTAAQSITRSLGERGAAEIAESMADAHLDGVAIFADPVAIQRAERGIGELIDGYAPAATAAAQSMADSIEQAIKKYESGPREQNQENPVADALKKSGWTASNPTAVKANVEKQIITAGNNGLVVGAMEEEKLTGFEHISLMDDRTTLICRQRNGLKLPMDDPYWLTGFAPLHWGCRSLVWPIFTDFISSAQLPTTMPDPGFGRAPWGFEEMIAGWKGKHAGIA